MSEAASASRTRRTAQRVVAIQPVPTRRLLAVYLIMAAGLAGLAARLAWVQVVDGSRLQSKARAVQTHAITPIGKRRTIVDRNGRLVALDEERFTLWAHPRYFNFPGDDPQKRRTPAETAVQRRGPPPRRLHQPGAGLPARPLRPLTPVGGVGRAAV